MRLNLPPDAPFDPRSAVCRRHHAGRRGTESRGPIADPAGRQRGRGAGARSPVPSAERADRPAQARRDRHGAGGRHRHPDRSHRPPSGAGPRAEIGALPRLRAGRDRRDRPDLFPRPVGLAGEAAAGRRDDDRLRPGRVVQRPPVHGPSRLRRQPRGSRDPVAGRAGLSDDRRAVAEAPAQGDRPDVGANCRRSTNGSTRPSSPAKPIRTSAAALRSAARSGGRDRHRACGPGLVAPRL